MKTTTRAACALLFTATALVSAANAADIRTRWVLEGTGPDGSSIAATVEGNDPATDLTIGAFGSGDFMLTLQAQADNPENLGFVAVRGAIFGSGLGPGALASNGQVLFSRTADGTPNPSPITFGQGFTAATLVFPTQPDPTDVGVGTFVDILAIDVAFTAFSPESYTFSYDPTQPPIQGSSSGVLVTEFITTPLGISAFTR